MDLNQWVKKATNSRMKRRRNFIATSLDKDGYTLCQICKCKMHIEDMRHNHGHRVVTVDHIIPLCRGGEDTHDNYIVCCFECNRSKGAFTLEELVLLKKYINGEKINLKEALTMLKVLLIESGRLQGD